MREMSDINRTKNHTQHIHDPQSIYWKRKAWRKIVGRMTLLKPTNFHWGRIAIKQTSFTEKRLPSAANYFCALKGKRVFFVWVTLYLIWLCQYLKRPNKFVLLAGNCRTNFPGKILQCKKIAKGLLDIAKLAGDLQVTGERWVKWLEVHRLIIQSINQGSIWPWYRHHRNINIHEAAMWSIDSSSIYFKTNMLLIILTPHIK